MKDHPHPDESTSRAASVLGIDTSRFGVLNSMTQRKFSTLSIRPAFLADLTVLRRVWGPVRTEIDLLARERQLEVSGEVAGVQR
jgi:hypothetical protein